MRKKSIFKIITFATFLIFVTPISSCKTGEGCPNQAAYNSPEDLSSKKANKKGKSSLFGKKAKKKKRKK